MNRIHLGRFELSDLSGLKLECDLFIPKVSNLPDVVVEFQDELIPSTSKLAKDPNLLLGISSFLKSIGYKGSPPIRLVDAQGKFLVAEMDLEFMSFAEGLGWIDLTLNEDAGAKQALFEVLDGEEQAPEMIIKESQYVFVADGRRYLVTGFADMADIVRNGILENLRRIEPGILAGHSSRKLSEGYEERKELIARQKDTSATREDFNEWMKQYLISDSSFFSFVATSLPKDEIYDIAFGGHLAGKTENHAVFELAR